MSRILRVAIADDHPIVREGLRGLVDACADLEVVAWFSNGTEVLDACERLAPDVLLLDISMPGPGFLELLRGIRKTHAPPAVLVLSAHHEDAFATRAMEAGASGYVNKQRSVTDLAAAIRAVASGRWFYGGRVEDRPPLGRNGPRDPSLAGRLSAREFQVFLMLGSGLRVTEIASRLALSPKTVSTHRTRILDKTGLETNAEIVRYVAASGLLD